MADAVVRLLERARDRSTLAQTLLPFCSDVGGEAPVALLVGNVNVRQTLRHAGRFIGYDQALAALRETGRVYDLTAELEQFRIQPRDTEEREVEIKEAWTEHDSALTRDRVERRSKHSGSETVVGTSQRLSAEIDALLTAAELEEEQQQQLHPNRTGSRIADMRSSLVSAVAQKPIRGLQLPRMAGAASLVGDIVEHAPEPREKAFVHRDEVSSRVLLSDMREADLKATSMEPSEEPGRESREAPIREPRRVSRFKSSMNVEQ